jgi:hypothetical protein
VRIATREGADNRVDNVIVTSSGGEVIVGMFLTAEIRNFRASEHFGRLRRGEATMGDRRD